MRKEANSIWIEIAKYSSWKISDSDFIKSVCIFFDEIKNSEYLSVADLKLLKYLSCSCWVPHYFDLLSNFRNDLQEIDFDSNTLRSHIAEGVLYTDDSHKIHRYQKVVLDRFESYWINKFFLTASTSFGKTHLLFEIIKKMKYKNVVLIFPTIALLAENLERISSDVNFSYFKDNFTVHTLSDSSFSEWRNLFIFTPERFLSFVEKTRWVNENFDFAFIDEAYKLDNEYIIDEMAKENERDVAYRLAIFETLKFNSDLLLVWPYIESSVDNSSSSNDSFRTFLNLNWIELINLNRVEIVWKSYYQITSKLTPQNIWEDISSVFHSPKKAEQLCQILSQIVSHGENAIVYCARKSSVESMAAGLIECWFQDTFDTSRYSDFIAHIENKFVFRNVNEADSATNAEWIVLRALRHGIWIHHWLVPKYIQKEMIRLFNEGLLTVLVSTTTITEGVNTSAKNLIVLSWKKWNKPLRVFDAKNISWRAGRFMSHYSGRVIILDKSFLKILNSESEIIRHKNYDLQSPKDEIDLFCTDSEFLNPKDIKTKQDILERQRLNGVPDVIMEQYKAVPRSDKLTIYEAISKFSDSEHALIKNLIAKINNPSIGIHLDGFALLIKCVKPIVKWEQLVHYFETRPGRTHPTLAYLVQYYLRDGFRWAVEFKIKSWKTIDVAIREASDFVYNVLKFHIVKYLGVFNFIYRHQISLKQWMHFDNVSWIDRLLSKFEYNAMSSEGKRASDFGASSAVIQYFEEQNIEKKNLILTSFDDYESTLFNRIADLMAN